MNYIFDHLELTMNLNIAMNIHFYNYSQFVILIMQGLYNK